MIFYLGTHQPHWLRLTDIPLFVSHRRLRDYKRLPRALGRWALDSGGYTELGLHGTWTTGPSEYAAAVRRYRDDVGGLDFASVQDWTCDPGSLSRTGLPVVVHQERTIDSYLDLVGAEPELPWMPVLQGETRGDYLDHVDRYARRGVCLASRQVVGLGSVARRPWPEVWPIADELAALGIKLHGFGLKGMSLRATWKSLASADSMAWSQAARREDPMSGCEHANCANCIRYALDWRDEQLARPGLHRQTTLLL